MWSYLCDNMASMFRLVPRFLSPSALLREEPGWLNKLALFFFLSFFFLLIKNCFITFNHEFMVSACTACDDDDDDDEGDDDKTYVTTI